MTHRKDKAEEQAIVLMERVVAVSEADRDALPGLAGQACQARHRDHAKAAQTADLGPQTAEPGRQLTGNYRGLDDTARR